VDTVGFAESADEIDIRVQQRPHALDIIGLLGVKVGAGDAVRRVICTHPLSMLTTNCRLQDLPIRCLATSQAALQRHA